MCCPPTIHMSYVLHGGYDSVEGGRNCMFSSILWELSVHHNSSCLNGHNSLCNTVVFLDTCCVLVSLDPQCGSKRQKPQAQTYRQGSSPWDGQTSSTSCMYGQCTLPRAAEKIKQCMSIQLEKPGRRKSSATVFPLTFVRCKSGLSYQRDAAKQ